MTSMFLVHTHKLINILWKTLSCQNVKQIYHIYAFIDYLMSSTSFCSVRTSLYSITLLLLSRSEMNFVTLTPTYIHVTSVVYWPIDLHIYSYCNKIANATLHCVLPSLIVLILQLGKNIC